MNNLKFVNCGIKKDIEGLTIEILSHNFHNPYCNIICTYFMENDKKIELTYYKNIKTNEEGHEIYKFKNTQSIQHYWSRCYNKNNLPKKYEQIANQLKEIFSKINFEEYKTRVA